MYWIYDIPNWQLCVLTLAAFIGLAEIGLFATRPLARKILGGSGRHNDVVSFFLAGIGVLYGLALGLIAVATWQDFSDIDSQVSKEAATLAGLYRDLDGYPQPLRGQLEGMLREYTRNIVEAEWPAHRRGATLPDGSARLDAFENAVMAFEPTKEREKIAHAEVVRDLNAAVEQRGLRVDSVDSGLPAALWAVVLAGAVLNIALNYLFWVENLVLHAILIGALSAFIALIIFLTAAMDNPFRGEFSVDPGAYSEILQQVMKADPIGPG